jgi:hypothetical protein
LDQESKAVGEPWAKRTRQLRLMMSAFEAKANIDHGVDIAN